MIKYDKEQNLMVELLEVQRPLPIDIIQEYDHKKVMKDVKKIIENGYTYQTEDTIYFDTSKLDNYGILSGKK